MVMFPEGLNREIHDLRREIMVALAAVNHHHAPAIAVRVDVEVETVQHDPPEEYAVMPRARILRLGGLAFVIW